MDVKSTTINTFHINCVKEHECKIERYNVVFFTTQFFKNKMLVHIFKNILRRIKY